MSAERGASGAIAGEGAGRAAAGMSVPSVGAPMDRVDGRLKVTGAARFAAEMPVPRVAHAVLVTSTVARGRVTAMEAAAAERAPGVLAVITPRNAMRLPDPTALPPMRVPTLLQDDRVHYNGQPIGVVVAETLEQAMEGARLVRATYAAEPPRLEMAGQPTVAGAAVHPTGGAPKATTRGDVRRGLAEAAATVDHTYTTPLENHNPLEPHNTVAVWEGDRLTLYDSTQGIFSVRQGVARTFGMPAENVRVVSPFTGGGFGSKGGPWSHVFLAAMAAKQVRRPVKLVLTRRQMFGPVGGRPRTVQRITLGAARDGRLTAVRHTSVSNTSELENWLEPAAMQTRILYDAPNLETDHDLVVLNVGSPTFMRAPGEASGTFALESALDELAWALKMDPVELRLRNHADRDPESGLPWSSKSLRECYRVGAERFGWARRPMATRATTDGRWLVGWGTATATYPARRAPASAVARILPDGRAWVRAGSQEIGCGTYTVMTQIAADALGLPPERVRFELGDTDLPPTPVSAGSMTAASTGPAVHAAASAARAKLVRLAVADAASPLHGAREEEVVAADGRLSLASDRSRSESFADVVARTGGQPVEARADERPGAEQRQYSMHSFGAVFAEVRVDRELGQVRVPRVVGAYGCGRILNRKTAHSQMHGGVIWGIGMALMEATHIDPRTGRYVNADLAEYHVPVNADVGAIDITFVDEHDPYVNPLGVKGVGEIGITGVAAAIANAVYHATGTRVRDLPITPEKLL